jgi:hypothetical protein
MLLRSDRLGHSLVVWNGASGDESSDGTSLWTGDGEPASAGDDEVHDSPGEGETARLAREAADHLGSPSDFLQRALQ